MSMTDTLERTAGSAADAAAAEPLVRIQQLSKQFGSGAHPVRAVDNVSFDIFPGETLGLVGESGSGKSTIGRLLTRLIEPTAGSLQYRKDGQVVDLAHLSQRELRPLRSDIQIIFQDPYASLNPRMRIRDVLGEALSTHGMATGAARQKRIEELLEQVWCFKTHVETRATDDVVNLVVPIPDMTVQMAIAAEVQRRRELARRLRAEAEAGWSEAKRWFEEQLLGPAP